MQIRLAYVSPWMSTRSAQSECGKKTGDRDIELLHEQESVRWLSGFYTHGHFSYTALGMPLEGELFLVLGHMR